MEKFIRYFFCVIAVFYFITGASAQVAPDKYVAWLTDKNNNPFSLNHPEEFLSSRALERRARYNIPLDDYDLPVTPAYINQIKQTGVNVLHASKWLNFVAFETPDTNLVNIITQLPFVKKVEKMKKRSTRAKSTLDIQQYQGTEGWGPVQLTSAMAGYLKNSSVYDYGGGANQIQMIKCDALHNEGFTGEGMLITLLDAGYASADQLQAFSDLISSGRLLGTRDFVLPGNNVFDPNINGHGTMVLSTMAAYQPGVLIGTAPHASYFLIRTEDGQSEYVIEEYNWVRGAELADSLGADIINSSLGYTEFDDPSQNHTYSQMDGNTAISTQGADRAASRGILVVNSAGNSGTSPWYYIGAPADGDSVFTIGAVDAMGQYATFSSKGPTYDGRIKPNIATQGQGSAFIGPWGGLSYGNGTSFSSPIAAGCMACLWQAHPERNNVDLMNTVMTTASQSNAPDMFLGYGIPDFLAAHQMLTSANNNQPSEIAFSVMPNPFASSIRIIAHVTREDPAIITLLNASGSRVYSHIWSNKNPVIDIINLDYLSKGLYFLEIQSKQHIHRFKLLKI